MAAILYPKRSDASMSTPVTAAGPAGPLIRSILNRSNAGRRARESENSNQGTTQWALSLASFEECFGRAATHAATADPATAIAAAVNAIP
jgi:hypothetical protein